MKKILIYFNSMQPSGGIERVIATLSNKLSSYYEITILVKDKPVSFYELDEKIKIVSLHNELKFNMNSQLSRVISAISTIFNNRRILRAYIKSHHFDIYYLAHPLNVLEFNLAGAERDKIIITEHGAKSAYNFVYRFIKKILYKRCAKYIVPTKTDTKLYQIDGLPAVYVPHFRPDLPYSLSKKNNNIVLNIGRFTSDKQQIVLLSIWERIINIHKKTDWILQLVGKGELENDLHNYVKENNLEPYVQFLPPVQQVENYYKNASVFALTSSSEGFGMVLLEAISFGLPCVSFDCPSGPRDIIKNDINGFLIDLNDKLKFEESLFGLMNDKEKIDVMGLNAFKNSIEWSDDVILANWVKVFEKD